jgi:ABC-type nitrate/sulfonate/bicarbonate transport system permease component
MPRALGLTLRDWCVAVAISELFGIMVGVVVGIYRWLDDLIGIYISFLVTAPVIIFVPLVTILVGFGESSRVIVAVLFALPAAVVNAATAVRTTDKDLSNVVRSFGGNRLRVIWHVILPSSIPANLAAARNVTARALLGVLVAELTLAVGGIGGLLLHYGGQFATADVFAGIVAVSILAIASLLIIDAIQRWLPWNRCR